MFLNDAMGENEQPPVIRMLPDRESEKKDQYSPREDILRHRIENGTDRAGHVFLLKIVENIHEPNENANRHLKELSQRYNAAASLLEDKTPGKVLEMIHSLEGLAHAEGLVDFRVDVSVPEGTGPVAREMFLRDRAQELYHEIPYMLAGRMMDGYVQARILQEDSYNRVDNILQSNAEDISRAELRTRVFAHERQSEELTRAEDKLIKVLGVEEDVPFMVEHAASRRELESSRTTMESALRIGDRKRNNYVDRHYRQALRARDENYRRISEIRVALQNYAAGVQELGEDIDVQIANIKNGIKGFFEVTVGRLGRNIEEKVNSVRENMHRRKEVIESDVRKQFIQEKREYYNKRHDKAVSKLMKTEEAILNSRLQRREISQSQFEDQLAQRRAQIENQKTPNEAVTYFLDLLEDRATEKAYMPSMGTKNEQEQRNVQEEPQEQSVTDMGNLLDLERSAGTSDEETTRPFTPFKFEDEETDNVPPVEEVFNEAQDLWNRIDRAVTSGAPAAARQELIQEAMEYIQGLKGFDDDFRSENPDMGAFISLFTGAVTLMNERYVENGSKRMRRDKKDYYKNQYMIIKERRARLLDKIQKPV